MRRRVLSIAAAIAPLTAITAVGALLRLWSFSQVTANPFYDAAVRSMTLSWHNFLFGAFEPSAQVSVDKVPADLWLQVASVKLFGFSSTSLRLPEAIAGILAIPLLYDLVRRLFGKRAGIGAAAALAVLPTAILTAHSDTMDSVMMLLDVLAAWLVVAGARSRRAWPVIAAGAVLGLAFNVKLFQALIVVPALGVLMLIALQGPLRRRAAAIAGFLVAFVAVSLSWIALASQTALGKRPWPIGSTDGSVWNVVFMFNGIDRLRGAASPGALALDPPGALRFFHATGPGYATTVGSMLIAALVLGATGAAARVAIRRRGIDRVQLAGAVFLGVWLVVGVGVLSHMQRMQPRYLEAVTPAIAAVAGAGLAGLVAAAASHRRAGAAVLAAAVAGTAAGGALLANPPAWAVAVALGAVAACVVVAATLKWPQRAATLAVLGLVAVLAVPASGAIKVARAHRSDAGLPVPPVAPALSAFLISHQGRARYEVASPTVARSSTLIAHDARPVLMLTSLYARPLLDAAQLRHLVATGQVRYMLGRGSCGTTHCPPVVQWARAHAHDVSASAGLPKGTLTQLTLTPRKKH